ncbi:helix-turn-helix domain-containing protein [Leifsonia sp. 22587]|uniref:helix-turn-helix domain-containing protein n=1 Tax=Leifsonia sp. 22587 TaxID=3453946 RepID=UPI003F8707BF
MTTAAMHAPATLDELLATLEWQVEESRREDLRPGTRVVLSGPTLLYVVDGSVRVRSAGPQPLSFAYQAGDVVFTPGRQSAEMRAETDGTVVVSELRPTAGFHALDRLPDLLGVHRLADLDPGIALLASRMGCGTGERRAGDRVICGRMATTIVAVAIRAWAEGDCVPDNWPAVVQDPFLNRVLDAMHANPGHPWTLRDLAAVGAMSRTTFAERFREQVGQSPASYLAQVRMDAAMTYLSQDGLTVSETARLLGYESDAGFSRAFRRHTGAVPSVWRQRAS